MPGSEIAGIKECAAFSLEVYRDKDRPPIPPGFIWLCDCPTELQNDSYFGAAYYFPVTDEMFHVVIAHRGTVLTFGNIMDDLLLALQIAPDAFELSAKPFTKYVKNLLTSKFPKIFSIYVHTGHSLGAIHTELCVANESANALGVTFESPGSKPIIVDLVSKGKLPIDAIARACLYVNTYNADVNAVNSCNEQISMQVSLCRREYSFGTSTLLPMDRIYYISEFTLDQHSMLKMYLHWQRVGEEKSATGLKSKENRVASWPIGFSAGYSYYMKYSNHPDYWDAALRSFWDKNPDVQAAYKGKYSDYYAYMKKTYFPDGACAIKSILFESKLSMAVGNRYQFFKHYHQVEREVQLLDAKIDSEENLSTEELARLKEMRFFKSELDESHTKKKDELEFELEEIGELDLEKRQELKFLCMLLFEADNAEGLASKTVRIEEMLRVTL
jgi:hypothetical protein